MCPKREEERAGVDRYSFDPNMPGHCDDDPYYILSFLCLLQSPHTMVGLIKSAADLLEDVDLLKIRTFSRQHDAEDFHKLVAQTRVICTLISEGRIEKYVPPSASRTKKSDKEEGEEGKDQEDEEEEGKAKTTVRDYYNELVIRKSGPSIIKCKFDGHPKGIDVRDLIMLSTKEHGISLSNLDLSSASRRNETFTCIGYILGGGLHSSHFFRLSPLLPHMKKVKSRDLMPGDIKGPPSNYARSTRSSLASRVKDVYSSSCPEGREKAEAALQAYLDLITLALGTTGHALPPDNLENFIKGMSECLSR